VRSSSTPAPSPAKPRRRPARRSAAPRASSRPAHPRHRLRGADRAGAWAALPGVARVIGNGAKLDPPAWDAPVAPIAREAKLRPAASTGTRAFLAVQQGCDHACTFCIIPQVRGPARALPVAEAVSQVRALATRHAEVVLTGVDLASHPEFSALLRAILREVPELPRLRLSSLDPAALDGAFLGRLRPRKAADAAAAPLAPARRRPSSSSACAAGIRARTCWRWPAARESVRPMWPWAET
jgi:hypothetical protein